MSEGLNLQRPNFSRCRSCSVSPPVPCPPHPKYCELLVLLLGACCSLRKLPKMVAQGACAGGRKRRSAGRCRAMAQPPPRRLLQLAGTRMTNSSVAATGLEQPPRGKGSRAEAPPRAADTSVLMGAPGSRVLCSSLSLSFSHMSSGDPGDTDATLWDVSRAAGRDPRWLLGAARRAGGGSPSRSHPCGGVAFRVAVVTPRAMPKLNELKAVQCRGACRQPAGCISATQLRSSVPSPRAARPALTGEEEAEAAL